MVSCLDLSAVFQNTFLFNETKVLLHMNLSGIINWNTFSVGPSVIIENAKKVLLHCEMVQLNQ